MSKIYEIAARELGQKEIQGGENPRILEYWRATDTKVSSDETPWCAAFVNWVLMKAGIDGTFSPLAKSFLHWKGGNPIKIQNAMRGDVVVLERAKPHPTFGHVAFFDSYDAPINTIRLLGGNQSNSVSISSYPVTRVISILRPIMPPTPSTKAEKFGIEATKRGIDNIFAVGFAVADGIQPQDIIAVPRLIDLFGQIPEIIKESTDYSEKELAEIGQHVLKQFGLRI